MSENTETFGLHLMVDGYDADESLLRDKEALLQILDAIPKSMGMHCISDPVVVEVGPKNRKDPGGLSGFVLIAESHVSFHTFPKRGFVTIDVYTTNSLKHSYPLLALDVLTSTFKNGVYAIRQRTFTPKVGNMDKKSKYLIYLFLLLIFLSVVASYYRVFIIRDYIIIPV